MEGGEDAKTPPQRDAFFHFATMERAVQIKLLTSKKALKIVCIEPETCQTHQSISPGHGFLMRFTCQRLFDVTLIERRCTQYPLLCFNHVQNETLKDEAQSHYGSHKHY